MAEPRPDMLPEESLTTPEVVPTPQTPVAPVAEQAQPETPKGAETPDNRLYAALQEERAKRKDAEQRIKDLESASMPSEDMSDEGRELRKEIASLRDEIALEKLLNKFPVLEEKQAEFDEFRSEYPRTKLENVAKLFLVEKGLMETTPDRKGLERPTGGPKTAPQTKYTGEDISNMMKNDNRRFQRLVREGKIKPEDISSEA